MMKFSLCARIVTHMVISTAPPHLISLRGWVVAFQVGRCEWMVWLGLFGCVVSFFLVKMIACCVWCLSVKCWMVEFVCLSHCPYSRGVDLVDWTEC